VSADEKGAAKKVADGGGVTLRYQDKLPKLPIPPLDVTLDRYLRALEGLQVSLKAFIPGVQLTESSTADP
jgi:hypothetical protein